MQDRQPVTNEKLILDRIIQALLDHQFSLSRFTANTDPDVLAVCEMALQAVAPLD